MKSCVHYFPDTCIKVATTIAPDISTITPDAYTHMHEFILSIVKLVIRCVLNFKGTKWDAFFL